MRVLTYTPVPADSFGTDSFYAIWITPPDNLSDEEIIPKDINNLNLKDWIVKMYEKWELNNPNFQALKQRKLKVI